MAIGSYGIVRPADVSPDDVDIFYHYVSGRTATSPVTFKKLSPASDYLTPVLHNGETGGTEDVEVLGGLYNLKLAAADFSELGIYTLHMRPKQIRTVITDCGILASLPSVRGLVIDLSALPSNDRGKFSPQGVVGYRVEYLDSNGKKIPNFYRIITSNFYCEPVISNTTNTNQKSIRYRYTDAATNFMFLTITPSAAPSTRPTTVPFIGQPNQNIILTNTYFNPTTVEVEMIEHDASTLAHALYGNQSKSVSDGVYTIYDNNNSIYRQYNLYEIRDQFNALLYEVRQSRGNNIDFSKNFTTITT